MSKAPGGEMIPRSIVPVTFVAVLWGCGSSHQRAQDVPENQRRLALSAVDNLREGLNRNCNDILNLAMQALRSKQYEREWTEACGLIRETLGDWRSFDANYWRGHRDVIEVGGIAAFAKGKCDVWLVWDLRPRCPRMMRFYLQRPKHSIRFPSPPNRLFDPPMNPDRQES